MITRRAVLKLMAALGTLSAWPSLSATGGVVVGAADHRDGRHGWAIARAGEVIYLPLPARGHGLSAHPRVPGLAVLMGRRPANTGWVLDVSAARVVKTLQALAERRFYGHAGFSPDGERLYTTENATDSGQGVLGVWDSASWRRLDEWPLPGIGPHELVVRPDGRLIVALGGVATHPDSGRTPLNLDTMDPSVVTLADDGRTLTQARTPDPKLSLRHLGLAADGSVAVAGQYRREASTVEGPLPLLYRLDASGQLLSPYVASSAEWAGFNDYLGSVAVHPASGCAVVTSPRGGRVGIWGADARLRATVDLTEVCGLAVHDGLLTVSNSYGRIEVLDLNGRSTGLQEAPDLLWDNHLLWLPA